MTEQAFLIASRKPGEKHSRYAYRSLRQNIMECRLKPGSLINEGSLAVAMGISRTPVHEAILCLRDETLIDVIPRKESRVSFINLELVNEGIFLRCAYESELVRSLAGNIGAEPLRKLQENLAYQVEIFQQGQDLNRFYPADDEFHHLLYLAANKPQAYASMRSICSHLDRVRYFVRMEEDTDIERMSLAEHRQMLLYLMMGLDPDADLHALFRNHITRFQKQLPKYLDHYRAYFVLDGSGAPPPSFTAPTLAKKTDGITT